MDEMRSIELLQPNPPPPAARPDLPPEREAGAAPEASEEYAGDSEDFPRSALPYFAGLVLDMFA